MNSIQTAGRELNRPNPQTIAQRFSALAQRCGLMGVTERLLVRQGQTPLFRRSRADG